MSLTTVMTRCLIDFWKSHHDFLPVWHCPPRRSHDEISEIGPSRAKVVHTNVILVSYYGMSQIGLLIALSQDNLLTFSPLSV